MKTYKEQGLEEFLKFRADIFNRQLESLGITAKIRIETAEEKAAFLTCLNEIAEEDSSDRQKTDLE